MKPPKYEALNIQLKGYDFEVLENHQSYIHNLAENIGINVGVAWATACDSSNASIYAPQVRILRWIQVTWCIFFFDRRVIAQHLKKGCLWGVDRRTCPLGYTHSGFNH